MADVRTIAFTKIVKEKLFEGNEFVNMATSHDSLVNSKTVEVPQAGTIPDVEEDRSSFPIAVTERTDDKSSYNLIEFSVGTVRIPDRDKSELSYDVASSIVSHNMNKLNDSIGLRGAYNWSGSGLMSAGGQIILTDGADTANIAPPSGTGNRKSVTLLNIATAAKKLDKDLVSKQGRYLLFSSDMYWDFVEKNKAQLLNLDYNKNLTNEDISSGIVAKVYGFNILTRAHTSVYADAATPTLKAVGAAGAATDHWSVIGWQKDEVAKALGAVKMFYEYDSPIYQGDIVSGLIRFNNHVMRSDGKGLVTIVQDS